MIGGGGNDRFHFAQGNGHLTIKETDWTATPDNALHFGAGILPGQVTVTRSKAGDIVLDAGGGDQVTITAMNGKAYGVQSVHFTDGTIWTAQQVLDRATQGTAAAESLYGASTDDRLDGHGGLDTLYGRGGEDTYVFQAGYGPLKIWNMAYETTVATGHLEIGGYDKEDLWLTRKGSDLVITALGSSDSITVQSWYNKARAQLEDITAGGEQLDAGIGSLVSAMASYAAANPGFNPATAGSMPVDAALQAALASAWHL